MLTPQEAANWQTAYNIAYYVLLIALFVSFAATGLTFLASNRLSADLTERLTHTTNTASEARTKAATLEKDAASAKLEQEKLKSQNIDLQKLVEDEKSERLELQRKFSWRTLPAETLATLQERLKSIRPSSINLLYIMNDSESLYFAIQIDRLLSDAGWHVNAVAQAFPDTIVNGITSPASADFAGNELIAAFIQSGIEIRREKTPQSSMSFGEVDPNIANTIVVGSHLPL